MNGVQENRVNTAFFQTGPNTYELVCTSPNGQFMARLECVVPSVEALVPLANVFAQAAANAARNTLVRANSMPPFPPLDGKGGKGRF